MGDSQRLSWYNINQGEGRGAANQSTKTSPEVAATGLAEHLGHEHESQVSSLIMMRDDTKDQVRRVLRKVDQGGRCDWPTGLRARQ